MQDLTPIPRKWLEYGMFGVASVGVILGALAMLHI